MAMRIIMLIMAMGVGLSLAGCSNEADGPDYDDQARQEIDESNMDQELQNLEAEIDAPDLSQ